MMNIGTVMDDRIGGSTRLFHAIKKNQAWFLFTLLISLPSQVVHNSSLCISVAIHS